MSVEMEENAISTHRMTSVCRSCVSANRLSPLPGREVVERGDGSEGCIGVAVASSDYQG